MIKSICIILFFVLAVALYSPLKKSLKLMEYEHGEELRSLLGLMMMVLLERRRG